MQTPILYSSKIKSVYKLFYQILFKTDALPIVGPNTNVPVNHRYNTPSPKTVLRGDPQTELQCFFSGKYVNPSFLFGFYSDILVKY